MLLGLSHVVPLTHIETLTAEQISILTVVQDVTLGAVLLGLLRVWPKLRAGDLGLTARPDLRLGIGAGAALWVLSIVIANAQEQVVGAHPQALIVAASANQSVEGLVLYLVLGAALVGSVEELFFRAVLFTLFRQRMRFAYAAVVSSVVFMLGHEPAVWLPVFALGLALALLYEVRHSLWTNAFAHATFNAISFVLLFVLPNLGN